MNRTRRAPGGVTRRALTTAAGVGDLVLNTVTGLVALALLALVAVPPWRR